LIAAPPQYGAPQESPVSTQPSFDRESFDEAWPALAERLRRTLTARGVPVQDRDDVLQETALRVYRSWATIDPTRPAWPFVITVAINIWRDIIRERTGRIAQCHPSDAIEITADQDVERDVLARQELASTVVAMRALAPEQRRLLLASEEFGDTVRPLLAAERVARMRVRRQLARAVGRASAAFALIFIRRPGRSSGAVATAYAGALAAAVLTTPAMVTTPAISALPSPHIAQQQVASTPHDHFASSSATGSRTTAAAVAATVGGVTSRGSGSGSGTGSSPTSIPRTKVCSPAKPPVLVTKIVVKIGPAGVYGSDGSGGPGQPIAATPPVTVRSNTGCIAVGD